MVDCEAFEPIEISIKKKTPVIEVEGLNVSDSVKAGAIDIYYKLGVKPKTPKTVAMMIHYCVYKAGRAQSEAIDIGGVAHDLGLDPVAAKKLIPTYSSRYPVDVSHNKRASIRSHIASLWRKMYTDESDRIDEIVSIFNDIERSHPRLCDNEGDNNIALVCIETYLRGNGYTVPDDLLTDMGTTRRSIQRLMERIYQ